MRTGARNPYESRTSKKSKPRHDQSINNRLVVEIRIKDRQPKDIIIANIHNEESVNRQIRWFLKANNLKEKAFNYIKTIIQEKIKEKKQIVSRIPVMGSRTKIYFQNKQNQSISSGAPLITEYSSKDSQYKTPQLNGQREPKRIQIKLESSCLPKEIPEVRVVQDTFAFNSQFTLPSSIGQQEKSQFTDQMFETEGRNASNFSTVNQIRPQEGKRNKINAPLSIKRFPQNFDYSTIEMSQQTETKIPKKKNPLKINFNGKDKQLIPVSPSFRSRSHSGKRRSMSTKERKDSIMKSKSPRKINSMQKEEFIIYDADNLQNLVTIQSTELKTNTMNHGEQFVELCEDLKMLFDKMTSKNPHSIHKLDSQYVSYQDLTKEELLLMGSLFQKMDHNQLSNLEFDQFKQNVLKYCRTQLEDLHVSKQKISGRMSWTFPAPSMPKF